MRKFGFWVVFVLCFFEGFATRSNAIERVCLPLFSIRLSDSPTCRASFEDFCFSRETWAKILRQERTSRCFGVDYRTREWVFLRNEPEIARKPVRRRFQVQSFFFLPVPGPSSIFGALIGFRERQRERVSETLAPFDASGVLRKLVLDESSDAYRNNTLRAFGFVHLLSASGIHLMALAAWMRFLIIHFGGVLKRFKIRFENDRVIVVAQVAQIALWVCAWSLTGMRLGMLRPVSLVLIRLVASRLGIRLRMASTLVLVFVVDSVFHSIGNPGQWHYLLAVWGGVWAADFCRRTDFTQAGWVHAAMAVASWLAVAAIDVFSMGWVQPYTAVLSWLTVPLCSLFIYPLSFFGALLSGEWGRLCIEIASHCLRAIEKLSLTIEPFGAIVLIDRPSAIAVGALLVFLTFMVPRLQKREAIYGMLFVCALGARPVLAWVHGRKSAESAAVLIDQLDVGQGDAALIRFGSRVGMIDVGPERSLTRFQWLEIFAKRGIDRLDFIMLTHLDADHSGAVSKIASVIRVDCLYVQKPEIESARGERYLENTRPFVRRFTTVASDCIPFPVFEFVSQKRGAPNGMMAMAFVPLADKQGFYLNTGDAPAETERWLVQVMKRLRNASVSGPIRILKLGHHGSKTSTDPSFLDYARPSEVWVSAGFQNSYHHPHRGVLQLVENKGIFLKRTDISGLIRWKN